MSKFTFTDPATGNKFSVTAPAGVSAQQAQSIFKQQLDTGSLAGASVGSAVNAATQAAKGLASARAMVGQNIGALAGRLAPGTDLNTISSTLGPGALAATSQVVSRLQGSGLAQATNFVSGSTNAVASALRSSTTGIAQTATAASNLATQAGALLSGTVTSSGSIATKTVSSVASGLGGPVTNGINVADIVKQGTVPGLPDLSGVNVQAAMSQAAKLVGQPHTVASNTLGVGKFGLNLQQLETAGFIKPGLAAKAAASGASLTSVLNSTTAFTGKDGVKNLDSLLNNESLQNNIQKNLMGNGLSTLKSVGVPVTNLSPQAVAGLANNAAKSVSATLASIQGTASPSVKSAFDTITRNSAFAVKLVENKVGKSVLGEVPPRLAASTVNLQTLSAASARIIGNNKIPDVLG